MYIKDLQSRLESNLGATTDILMQENVTVLLQVLGESWHLEGWNVFGQDPINDMISEEQDRILGVELSKGSSGSIKSETDLITFLKNGVGA